MRLARRSVVPFLIVLALLASACGPKTIHTAALISDQFSQGLVTAQQAVTSAYQLQAMDQDTYRGIQKRFEQVATIGLSINTALRTGNNQAAIVQVTAALGVVDTLIAQDIPKLKPDQRILVSLAVAAVKTSLLAYAGALGGG